MQPSEIVEQHPPTMELVQGDIKKFNKYDFDLQDSLLECGEQCPYLLVNLFTAYCMVQEIDFKGFMKLKYTF